MLTIHTGASQRDCSRLARRDFLQIGGLGLSSLALPQLLSAASGNSGFVRDKSVVLLFLAGGASHIETFNPNLDAPAPYSSVTGEVKTSIPGLTLGGTFPQIAEHADLLAPVRSFSHPIGDHVKAIAHVLSGGTDPAGDGKAGQSMGSVYSRIRGANHPDSGLPTYVLASSSKVDPQYVNERSRIANGSRPGGLGLAYGPFDPAGGGTALKNMQLNISTERLDDRRELLGQLDTLKRNVDASGAIEGLDKFEQQALDLVTRGASEAFDVKRESRETLERYDTSRFRVGKKLFQPTQIGRQMLLARRLVEAGCGFVTVQNVGWDNHADGNNPGIADGMQMLGRPLDRAVSAFLSDLRDRGLSEKVLLVITGDFGRTPKINPRGGRDHWSKLCTLCFAGGGLKTGQIVGQSGRNNDEPATEPVTLANVLGTVMHTLFDVGKLRLDSAVPRDLLRLIEASPPIKELV